MPCGWFSFKRYFNRSSSIICWKLFQVMQQDYKKAYSEIFQKRFTYTHSGLCLNSEFMKNWKRLRNYLMIGDYCYDYLLEDCRYYGNIGTISLRVLWWFVFNGSWRRCILLFSLPVYVVRILVLWYTTISATHPEYFQPRNPYFGATLGRCANYVGGATISVRPGGRVYMLSANRGRDHFNGGHVGFDKVRRYTSQNLLTVCLRIYCDSIEKRQIEDPKFDPRNENDCLSFLFN